MKTFKIQLWTDMRVVVVKRANAWEVWPQQWRDGKWTNHAGDAVHVSDNRVDAMLSALEFSHKLIRKVEGMK